MSLYTHCDEDPEVQDYIENWSESQNTYPPHTILLRYAITYPRPVCAHIQLVGVAHYCIKWWTIVDNEEGGNRDHILVPIMYYILPISRL